jgi:hypothetical protein
VRFKFYVAAADHRPALRWLEGDCCGSQTRGPGACGGLKLNLDWVDSGVYCGYEKGNCFPPGAGSATKSERHSTDFFVPRKGFWKRGTRSAERGMIIGKTLNAECGTRSKERERGNPPKRNADS